MYDVVFQALKLDWNVQAANLPTIALRFAFTFKVECKDELGVPHIETAIVVTEDLPVAAEKARRQVMQLTGYTIERITLIAMSEKIFL